MSPKVKGWRNSERKQGKHPRSSRILITKLLEGKAGAESQEPPRAAEAQLSSALVPKGTLPTANPRSGAGGLAGGGPALSEPALPGQWARPPPCWAGTVHTAWGQAVAPGGWCPPGSFPQRVGEKYSLFTSVIKQAEREPEASNAICAARWGGRAARGKQSPQAREEPEGTPGSLFQPHPDSGGPSFPSTQTAEARASPGAVQHGGNPPLPYTHII